MHTPSAIMFLMRCCGRPLLSQAQRDGVGSPFALSRPYARGMVGLRSTPAQESRNHLWRALDLRVRP